MRNTLDDGKFKDVIKKEDKEKVEKAVKEAIEWVDNNPNAELDELEGKKKELEDLWKPIIMEAYKSTGGQPGPQGGMPGGMPNMGGMGGMPNMGNFQQPTNQTSNKGPEIDDVD